MCNCEGCEFKVAIQGFSPEKQLSSGELRDCFFKYVFSNWNVLGAG